MTAEQRRHHSSTTEADAAVTTATQEPTHEAAASAAADVNDHELHPSRRRATSRFGRALSLMASPLTDDTGNLRSVLAGLLSLFLVGATIGLVTPKNHSLPTVWYQYVSASIGYIYFVAWSVSFYPQVVSNFQRQSTVGLSADFCVLNVVGFACYAAYNASFFWSATIQELYKERNGPNASITVQSNDVAFAIHALILSSVTVVQIVLYGGEGGIKASLRLSRPITLVMVGILTVCAMYPLLIVMTTKGHNDDKSHFNWLDYLYLLSFVKIGISLIKYIPQVILNMRRQSTVGWSIWNILLDCTGGTLSILQLVLDCADRHDFSGITGNPAKFGLGFVSIVFDMIFMAQHYCLYNSNNDGRTEIWDEQREPLLSSADAARRAAEEGDETNATAVSSVGAPPSQPETIMV